jgi:hypothetical protein
MDTVQLEGIERKMKKEKGQKTDEEERRKVHVLVRMTQST